MINLIDFQKLIQLLPMRYLLMLVTCLTFALISIAQDSLVQKKKPLFFLSGTIGYANKGPLIGSSANVIFSSQFGIYARVFTNQFKSKLLPADFKPGTSLFGKRPMPQDVTNVYSIGAIKEITLKKTSYIYKAGFEFGPCLSFDKAAQFTPSNNIGGWLFSPSNYKTTFTKTNSFGLLLRSKLKMLDTLSWGIELVSSVVISKSSPFHSIELNITSGTYKGLKKRTPR